MLGNNENSNAPLRNGEMMRRIGRSAAFVVGVIAFIELVLGYILVTSLFDGLAPHLAKEAAPAAGTVNGTKELLDNLLRFSKYMEYSQVTGNYLLFASIPTLLLFALAIASYSVFKRFLLGHARMFSILAGGFTGRELNQRFAPGEFPEYQQLSETLNRMADEISERIKTQELEESDRQELMAGLAHDLRTPMCVIQGCAERLSMTGISLEQRESYHEMLKRNTELQLEYADDLEQLAAVERIRLSAPQVIDIRALIGEVVNLLEVAASRAQVTVRFDCQDSRVFCPADTSLLRRALLNLLDNAIRHSPSGSTVNLSVTGGNSSPIQIQVANTGKPLPLEARLRFETALAPELRVSKGRLSGLGLFIVKRIAHLHSGELSIGENDAGENVFSISLRGSSTKPPPESKKVQNLLTSSTPSIRLTGWLAVFSIVILCLVNTAFPATHALRWFFLVILMLGVYSAKPGLGKSTLLSLYLVISFSLPFLIAFESRTAFQAVTGAVTFQTAIQVFRLSDTRLWLRLCFAAAPFIVCLFLVNKAPWLFMLGAVVGGWISLVAWLADSAGSVRRAGVWLGALLLLSSGVSIFVQGGMLYAFIVSHIRSATERTSRVSIASVLSEIGRPVPQADGIVSVLQRAYAVNPIHGYILTGATGENHFSVGVEEKNRGIKSSSYRRALLTAPLCGEIGCPELSLLGPSAMLNGIVHRETNFLFLVLILFELNFSWLAISIFSASWRKEIAGRLDDLQAGIQKFASGDYSYRIALEDHDEIGGLAAKLNSMAGEISRLEAQRAERAAARNRFLDIAAPAIRECVANVSAHSGSGEWGLLQNASATLDKCIELLFVIAAFELEESSEIEERFPFDEHLLEVVESARHRCGAKDIDLLLQDCSESMVGSGPLGQYLLALKFVFECAFEEGRPGDQIRARVEKSGGKISVVLEAPSNGSSSIRDRGDKSVAMLRSLFFQRIGAHLRRSGGGLETSEAVAVDGSRVLQFRVDVREAENYREKS